MGNLIVRWNFEEDEDMGPSCSIEEHIGERVRITIDSGDDEGNPETIVIPWDTWLMIKGR